MESTMLICEECSDLPNHPRPLKPVFQYQTLAIGEGRWTMVTDRAINGSIHCATCGLVYADSSDKKLTDRMLKLLTDANADTLESAAVEDEDA